ncbi:transglutaminase-like cysteine peptidase [Roseateles sp. LKC17W]|uniref:Transglutaminase-like cysteine peptidase n=1 Tax=Pelomonas margarita TaxID=3299031 RepID=A0ABW7FGI4_9BURK
MPTSLTSFAVARRAGRWGLAALLVLPWLAAMAYDATRVMEAAAQRGPRVAEQALALLQQIERSSGHEDELQRLQEINDFFNRRVDFRDDAVTWGVPDYWASPLETLDRRAGDCEDYAIAKYFSLAAAGVPTARLRMVYVRARMQGQSLAHMVLAYHAQPGAEPLILDNLRPEVLPASQRSDLTPVFSFNTEGLWQGVGQVTAGDPLARLSLWRDLVAKVRKEGFI